MVYLNYIKTIIIFKKNCSRGTGIRFWIEFSWISNYMPLTLSVAHGPDGDHIHLPLIFTHFISVLLIFTSECTQFFRII